LVCTATKLNAKEEKMKISEMMPSKYLKTADLQGRQVRVVIESLHKEELTSRDGETESLHVMAFRGKTKRLVLKPTNLNLIATLHGDETDHWIGKEITLYPSKDRFGTKMVDCIRVMVPTAGIPAPAPAPVARPSSADMGGWAAPPASGQTITRQGGIEFSTGSADMAAPARAGGTFDDPIPFAPEWRG
jgi:hypothetical protein